MWPHCLLQGFPRQRRIVARHNGGTDLAEPEFPALAVECRVFFASGDLFSGWKRRWRGRGVGGPGPNSALFVALRSLRSLSALFSIL